MGVHKTSYAAVRDEPLYKDLHPSNIDHYVRQYKGNPQVMARLRQKGEEKAAERAEEDARVAKEQAKAAAQRKADGAPDASSSSSSSSPGYFQKYQGSGTTSRKRAAAKAPKRK